MSAKKRGLVLTRAKLMRVLDKTFAEERVKLTVRGYNNILTRLGFRLGRYGTAPDLAEEIKRTKESILMAQKGGAE